MPARRSGAKTVGTVEAKNRVVKAIEDGSRVREAMALVGRAEETYRDWMKHDPEFKARVQAARDALGVMADVQADQPVPDFETFCSEYLGEPLFPHMLRGVDLLEGREPRALHSSMVYEPGDPGRLLLNFPPNHAKTTAFAINYAVWRIHKNPNVKIAVISKTQGYAKKLLGAIKNRLTSNQYRAMHAAFAPAQADGTRGWKDPDQSWTQTQIYVMGKGDGEKDPTVEAVGLGGQIYGGRFDLIICDDVIDNENAHRWEDQVDWLMTMLDSRLPPEGGQMIVLGTRISVTDMYSELRKATTDEDTQFFTYLAQPAVLDYGEGGKDEWVTLWPWTDWRGQAVEHHPRCINCYELPDDCSCTEPRVIEVMERWSGAKLAKKRFPLGERRWALVWQQQQIPDDATFNQRAVEASINRMRKPGPMSPDGAGHRPGGMNGLYVVGGLDPATVGHTAMVIAGLDRATEKRYLLDGFNKAGTSPSTLRETVKRLTDQYRVNEWVIERNAFQRFLTQDPELTQYLQARGSRLREHYTGSEKYDPDFGVMGMAPLFLSCGEPANAGHSGMWRRTPDKALIELPDERDSAWVSDLVKQLIMWEPSGLSRNQKTDMVMALWFTEIAFQRILGRGRDADTHMNNPYATRGAVKARTSVNLTDLMAS